MDNKEAKARLMRSSKGELADRLLFAYATIQRLEAKLEGAKNTEQANQPDNLPEDGYFDYWADHGTGK